MNETTEQRAMRVAGRAIREAKACLLADNTTSALVRLEEAKIVLACPDDRVVDLVERGQRVAASAAE
jgi:hypothetical protein